MKIKVEVLRNNILENRQYLLEEYILTNDILFELNKMINWNVSHSLVFQWWIKNEDKIDIIHKLLERKK